MIRQPGLAIAVAGTCLMLAGCIASKPVASLPSGRSCTIGEQTIFACAGRNSFVSVCLGDGNLRLRYAPQGQPLVEVSSLPDWSNIHTGGNRSQGGLNQDYIRFTDGQTHYVVHSGYTGSLSEEPGQRISGVAAFHEDPAAGPIPQLSCPADEQIGYNAFAIISAKAPSDAGGPFDAIY